MIEFVKTENDMKAHSVLVSCKLWLELCTHMFSVSWMPEDEVLDGQCIKYNTTNINRSLQKYKHVMNYHEFGKFNFADPLL